MRQFRKSHKRTRIGRPRLALSQCPIWTLRYAGWTLRYIGRSSLQRWERSPNRIAKDE